MRKIIILLLFFTLGTIAEEAPYKHSIAGFESESELKPFYLKVKGAILSKDYHAIATMLSFPTSIYVDGIPTRVISKDEFYTACREDSQLCSSLHHFDTLL